MRAERIDSLEEMFALVFSLGLWCIDAAQTASFLFWEMDSTTSQLEFAIEKVRVHKTLLQDELKLRYCDFVLLVFDWYRQAMYHVVEGSSYSAYRATCVGWK